MAAKSPVHIAPNSKVGWNSSVPLSVEAATRQDRLLDFMSMARAPPAPPGPFVRIVEEPAWKLRYRYESEGRSESIPGASSTPERKTFPTIEIVGHTGKAIVVVSCVTRDEPYKPHPHNLVDSEPVSSGVCSRKVAVSADSRRVAFNNLSMQRVCRRDFAQSLSKREELRVDPFCTGYAHGNHPRSIDLNAVRLCFQVFLIDDAGEVHPLRPIVSDVIFDRKCVNDMSILRLSAPSGPARGGSELILLCEPVVRNDIEVVFYEGGEEDGAAGGAARWAASADVVLLHKQVAIVFALPPYRDLRTREHVQVYIQLRRPSDGARSLGIPFMYIPEQQDSDYLKHKRLKTLNTALIEQAGQNYQPPRPMRPLNRPTHATPLSRVQQWMQQPQPEPGMPQHLPGPSMAQPVSSMAQPGPGVPQPVYSMAQPGLSMAQPGPSMAQPSPSMAHPGPSMAQPVYSMPQPVYSMAQPGPSMAQPVYSMPQPVYSMAQPGPSMAQPVYSMPQLVYSMAQPGPSVPQPVYSMAQPSPSMAQPGPSVPQPVYSMAQPSLSMAQPGPSVPQPGPSVPQPVYSMAQPGPSVPQPVYSMAQPSPSMAQPGPSVPQPGPSVPQPVYSMAQPGPSVPQPVYSMAQPGPSMAQPVTSMPRPGPSVPQPGPSMAQSIPQSQPNPQQTPYTETSDMQWQADYQTEIPNIMWSSTQVMSPRSVMSPFSVMSPQEDMTLHVMDPHQMMNDRHLQRTLSALEVPILDQMLPNMGPTLSHAAMPDLELPSMQDAEKNISPSLSGLLDSGEMSKLIADYPMTNEYNDDFNDLATYLRLSVKVPT